MNRTLVAVFDSQDEARSAKQELSTMGLADDRVQMRAGTEADFEPIAGGAPDTGRRSFLERLFGGVEADEDTVGQYGEAVRRGGCLVIVDGVDEGAVDDVANVMSRHGAVDINERASSWRERGWTGFDASAPRFGDAEIAEERRHYDARRASASDTTATRATSGEDTVRIPVVEEQLEVGKRAVQRGGVRVFTRVAERPIEERVDLREERARVERHAVDRPATEADLGAAFKEGEIEVRETVEQPVVQKTARVVEEVEVGKEVAERSETVRDTVRRTEVDVEDLPASRAGGDGTTGRPAKP